MRHIKLMNWKLNRFHTPSRIWTTSRWKCWKRRAATSTRNTSVTSSRSILIGAPTSTSCCCCRPLRYSIRIGRTWSTATPSDWNRNRTFIYWDDTWNLLWADAAPDPCSSNWLVFIHSFALITLSSSNRTKYLNPLKFQYNANFCSDENSGIYNYLIFFSLFYNFLAKVSELHILNDNHVRVYLSMNPKEVEPLLIEIFDLKANRWYWLAASSLHVVVWAVRLVI